MDTQSKWTEEEEEEEEEGKSSLSKGDARLWEQDKWTRSSKGLHNPLPIQSNVNPGLINKSKWTEEEGNPTLSKGAARLLGTR